MNESTIMELQHYMEELGLKPKFIITGRQGATGKTYLCRKLNELGLDAIEEWLMSSEEKLEIEKKKNNGNSCIVTITLNNTIPVVCACGL